jgi:ADP-heptose:LPS heptosyltransferase
MRILVSNPDTLGDLILRQPMYAALQKEGHDLALIVRPQWIPLVPMIAPGARVLPVPVNVYAPSLTVGAAEFGPLSSSARTFKPDLFVVAPFQWTVMEERLSADLGVPTIVMSGKLFADPSHGPASPSGFSGARTVQVAEDTPEVRKNEQLAGAILGRAVSLPDPKLSASASQMEAGRAELVRLGLEPCGYWVCCVGDTEHTVVRNWRHARWSEVLSAWSKKHGRRFLFIGHESEAETTKAIREGMGDQRGRAVEWYGSGQGALDALVGLAALSGGYVGRDTGPMHLAAALGRPVLAVFGGGTWPRFVPAAEPGVTITVGVPCAGCGWLCHLEESYCIKEVPVAAVMEAVEGFENGTIKGRVTRLLRADEMLLSRIGREGASTARARLLQLAVARSAESGRTEGVVPTNEQQGDKGLTDAVVESAGSRAEVKPLAASDEGGVRRSRDELQRVRQELSRARARIGELEAVAAEYARHRAEQAGLLTSTRQLYAEAKARIEVLERRMEDRAADAAAAKEHARIKSESEAVLREKFDQAHLGQLRAEDALAARVKRQAELEARVKDLDAKLRTAASLGNDASRQREAQLHEQLNDARSRLSKAEGEVHDLRLRLTKLENDRATFQKVAQDCEAEVVVLRGRLRDLLASRWRRLGQRLHLAMTLPWEEPGGNGAAR